MSRWIVDRAGVAAMCELRLRHGAVDVPEKVELPGRSAGLSTGTLLSNPRVGVRPIRGTRPRPDLKSGRLRQQHLLLASVPTVTVSTWLRVGGQQSGDTEMRIPVCFEEFIWGLRAVQERLSES